jgi:uncharacterized membrane protein YfcA
MNRLQKAAWLNLIAGTICVAIAGLGFVLLARRNARGLDYILVSFVGACLIVPVWYFLYRKRSPEARVDERERMIYSRAFALSAGITMGFLGGICIVPFYVLGGQSLMHVYYLPVIFLTTLFTAQLTHSVAVLIQCELEADDGR